MIFIFGLLGSLLQWANNLTMSEKLSAIITMDGIIIVLVTSCLALLMLGLTATLILYLFKMLVSLIRKLFS